MNIVLGKSSLRATVLSDTEREDWGGIEQEKRGEEKNRGHYTMLPEHSALMGNSFFSTKLSKNEVGNSKIQ